MNYLYIYIYSSEYFAVRSFDFLYSSPLGFVLFHLQMVLFH